MVEQVSNKLQDYIAFQYKEDAGCSYMESSRLICLSEIVNT